jgi:muramidase (phage lysozyme)
MARLHLSANLNAFLDMLATAEGTIGRGDDGYNVQVGGALFDSYNDHPREAVFLRSYRIYSTAAGRYQFLKATWDQLAKKLSLSDFSPASQDEACIELLRQRKALPLIEQGRFRDAVERVRTIWASLPGAGYGQREVDLAKLSDIYVKAGGALA